MKKKICAFLSALLCVMSLLVIPVQAADYDLLLGDMDASGDLSPSDARRVLRMAVDLEEYDEETGFLANVDGNTEISPADARLVLRAAVKLESETRFYHFHTNEPFNSEGSCTEPQINGSKCTTCGMLQIESVVDAPGHDWTFVLSANGHMGDCDRCGKVEKGECELVEISRRDATCTADGEVVRNCLCGLREERETLPGGHQYSAWTKGNDGNFTSTCARCQDKKVSTTEKLLTWFNDNVNRLKDDSDYSQNIATISGNKQKMVPVKGSYTGLLSFAGLFGLNLDEELKIDTYDYDPMTKNRGVTSSGFPTFMEHYVSRLTAADVKSMDVTLGTKVDLLQELPDSFTDSKKNVWDLTAYKNTPAVTDAIRVTITLPTETIIKTDESGFDNIYAFKLNGKTLTDADVLPSEKFSLSSREFAKAFPMISNNSSFIITFDMTKADVNTTAVWYFDSETYEPIACKYVYSANLDQTIIMTGDFDIEGLVDKNGSAITNGSAKTNTEMRYDYYYLFSDYYPCMAE